MNLSSHKSKLNLRRNEIERLKRKNRMRGERNDEILLDIQLKNKI